MLRKTGLIVAIMFLTSMGIGLLGLFEQPERTGAFPAVRPVDNDYGDREHDRGKASDTGEEKENDTDNERSRKKEKWRPPVPKAGGERVSDRRRMVRVQIAERPVGQLPVKDAAVLEAMRTVPRHVFVPKARRRLAYRDGPLPIGEGQTISQPYIVAIMTELLELTPESKVLEVGTGSGYQAAVLGQLTPHVYTIEIIKTLARRAEKVLAEQGYDDVRVRQADGYFGWADKGPFDAIIVTCAAGHLPPPLWKQIKPGGRIVIPVGGPNDFQRLVVVTRTEEGKRRSRTVMGVAFVPMTGEVRKKQ